jgi:glutaconate CoA-transferase subunit A
MAGLRAASLGVPFEPVPGFVGTDLPAVAGFGRVKDPWTGEDVYVVPALRPAWAVLHVQEADGQGNARIFGSRGYDVLMAGAADRVILTTERIIPTAELIRHPEATCITDLVVAAVVEAPGGARPGGCPGGYDADDAALRQYLDATATPGALAAYLATTA